MPSFTDHVLIFLIAVALPIYSFYSWKDFQREIAEDRANARRNAYLETILIEWSLSLAVVIVWLIEARPFSRLGLFAHWNPRFAISSGFVVLACAFLIWQQIQVLGLGENIPDSLKAQIEPVKDILPHNAEERNLFLVVALTAGICEEFLYRAFLLWYAGSYADWWIGAILSVLVFGLGHLYQGKESLLKNMFAGIVLVSLYLISGSLIGPVILHSTTDITVGLIGKQVVTAGEKARQA